MTHKINKNDVRKSLLRNMDAIDRELVVVRDLRIAVKSGHRDHTGHVILRAPMVLIVQATLDQLGLHKFIKHISPSTRTGSTISLQLSLGVLCEMCGAKIGNFDIETTSGTVIRTLSDAVRPANKESSKTGSGASYIWSNELDHWQERGFNRKEIDHDPWELVQQQQQQAIMPREGYYLAELEKVAKAPVENKEKRCDILVEAQRDPNKVIAWESRISPTVYE
ncbi:hypothetical protein BGZ67_005715 [Mortierella alpina]|nr:hypothetical protein BGZ67_005715 [Mortierella alpina]